MGLFDFLKKKTVSKNENAAFSAAPAPKSKAVTSDIWGIEDTFAFVDAMLGRLCDKCGFGENISLLTAEERIFYIVICFKAEVENGGFPQYLYNDTGNYTDELIPSLRTVGADEIAEMYQAAFDKLGRSLPTNQTERDCVLDELLTDDIYDFFDKQDSIFYNISDNLEFLCQKYALLNKSSFI